MSRNVGSKRVEGIYAGPYPGCRRRRPPPPRRPPTGTASCPRCPGTLPPCRIAVLRTSRPTAQPPTGSRASASSQGLTLVHFSAQLEPCLTHKNTLHPLNTPYHPLETGYTTPTRTSYPIKALKLSLEVSERKFLPVVGELNLFAVDQSLLEHAVLIPQAVTPHGRAWQSLLVTS